MTKCLKNMRTYTPSFSSTTTQRAFTDEPTINKSLSLFKRDHKLMGNYKCDEIVPIFCMSTLPGDIMELKLDGSMQILNLLTPIMDILKTKIWFYYVPIRTIWKNWDYFMMPNDATDEGGNPIEVPNITPYIEVKPTLHSIYDYFGEPIDESEGGNVKKPLKINALPYRAYNKIWNEHFRSESLQDKMRYSLGDNGTDDLNDFYIQKTGKDFDYFTSALPWPQKGLDVEINFFNGATISKRDETKSDVIGNGDNVIYDNQGIKRNLLTVGLTNGGLNPTQQVGATTLYKGMVLSNEETTEALGNTPYGAWGNIFNMGNLFEDELILPSKTTENGGTDESFITKSANNNNLRYAGLPKNTTQNFTAISNSLKAQKLKYASNEPIGKMDVGNLKLDINEGNSLTINQLRFDILEQQFRELMARIGGERYNEFIYGVWGVDVGDKAIQRSEYLGSFEFPWSITPIAQTSEATENSPQGNLTAQAEISFSNKFCFRRAFADYGFIIGLMRTKGDLTYSQGQPEYDMTLEKGQYYLPQFEGMGEQPIYSKEIYATGEEGFDTEGNPAGDNEIFGYQPYGSRERYKKSTITGDFRPLEIEGQRIINLSTYTFSQRFSSRPTLSEEFLQSETPIWQQTSQQQNEHYIRTGLGFHVKHFRPVSVYSEPGVKEV